MAAPRSVASVGEFTAKPVTFPLFLSLSLKCCEYFAFPDWPPGRDLSSQVGDDLGMMFCQVGFFMRIGRQVKKLGTFF